MSKTNGHWANVRVLAYNSDKSKILLEYEDSTEKWIDTEKIKSVMPNKVMAYITLPTMGSRHFGMEYDGFCLER